MAGKSSSVCRPAVWFDHFFGDQRLLEDVRPGTFIKSRSAVRWTEGQKLKYLFDFHVQWQLPHWERYLRRIRIYYDSNSEATKFTTQPGQAIDPGIDPATGVRKPVLGARIDLYSRLRSLVSLDSGVKLSIHPDAFIRIRYEFARPFGEVYLIRFSQIAMWQAVEHFTDTSQLDFERTITTFSLIRWANNVTYTEGSNGVTWNTGFSFLTQLTPKSAISYDTSMWGVNYPVWTVQNYRVGIKYRKNFYRPWLFFELAPDFLDGISHRARHDRMLVGAGGRDDGGASVMSHVGLFGLEKTLDGGGKLVELDVKDHEPARSGWYPDSGKWRVASDG